MDMNEYLAEFKQLKMEIITKILKVRSIKACEKQITEMSIAGAAIYKDNSNYGGTDYPQRVQTFLNFDVFLKDLKRNFTKACTSDSLEAFDVHAGVLLQKVSSGSDNLVFSDVAGVTSPLYTSSSPYFFNEADATPLLDKTEQQSLMTRR